MEQSQAMSTASEGQNAGQMDLERTKRKAPIPSKAKHATLASPNGSLPLTLPEKKVLKI
jgi:hypothetical protein